MLVEELRLASFRNYRDARVRLAPGLNLIVGDNGQGKTNLLEAIHLAAGRGPSRFGGNSALVMRNSERATIEAKASRSAGAVSVRIEIDGRSRLLLVNGKKTRSLSQSPIEASLFCPETMGLIKEAAQARRDLVDGLAERLHPGYSRTRRDYTRVLRQRNRALQDGEAGSRLFVWDERLCELGAEMIVRRAQVLRRIGHTVSETYATLSGDSRPMVADYDSRLVGEDNTLEAVVERMKDGLRERRADEQARGITLVGPHRDDVLLALDGQPLRGFGSQGEQRTAALALVLAEAKTLGEATAEEPVLLLDDVVSELDDTRRRRLMEHLTDRGQTVITATNTKVTDEMPATPHIIRVCGGQAESG